MKRTSSQELAIVAVSGLNWPTRSRKYLINLVSEAVAKSGAKVALIAGHTVDGHYLESEFKARLAERLKEERAIAKESGDTFDSELARHQFEAEFVEEYVTQLNDFLIVLPNGVNWHIAIAERIYDRPIGARILEKLRDRRSDVRIIGSRLEDGYYDREPKFPVQFPGFDTIRVIVPHRSPWFSHTISNLIQRLHNAFAPRTLSPKPNLTITGVTGTAVHLPYYEGVPNVSVPALNKLLEQQATEHMIGANVIRLISNGDKEVRIKNGVHNFRIAAFQEKVLSIPASLPKIKRAIMYALVPSDASFKALVHRLNTNKRKFSRKTNFRHEKIEQALRELIDSRQIVFSKKSNRYGINEDLRRNAIITLGDLHKDSREVKHTVWSCLHGGALKTLYFTVLEDLPRMIADSDGAIENGDISQGNSHCYDYNGEVLPGFNTVDKQEILNAYIRATILIEAFKIRLERNKGLIKRDPIEAVEKSFPDYRFNVGNHDSWRFYAKVGLILQQFEDKLREVLVERIVKVCKENKISYTEDMARNLIRGKVKRVGESRMTAIGGVLVGVKHPYKTRTIQKSTRVQQVVDFIWRRFDSFTETVAKNTKGFALAYIANFHEAAAVHVTKYGQTVLGVMTGAYMHDTEFETNQDKVVDRGPANVMAILSPDGELLYSETEFTSQIVKEDYDFVTADRLSQVQVYERCSMLLKRIGMDIPWR